MTLLWVLALAAFVTSIISGIIGMGGGLLLLATMLSFLSHAETIPAHGAVQLVSNGTRLLVFLRHVDVKTVLRFAAGAVPGSTAEKRRAAPIEAAASLINDASLVIAEASSHVRLAGAMAPRSSSGSASPGPGHDGGIFRTPHFLPYPHLRRRGKSARPAQGIRGETRDKFADQSFQADTKSPAPPKGSAGP